MKTLTCTSWALEVENVSAETSLRLRWVELDVDIWVFGARDAGIVSGCGVLRSSVLVSQHNFRKTSIVNTYENQPVDLTSPSFHSSSIFLLKNGAILRSLSLLHDSTSIQARYVVVEPRSWRSIGPGPLVASGTAARHAPHVAYMWNPTPDNGIIGTESETSM